MKQLLLIVTICVISFALANEGNANGNANGNGNGNDDGHGNGNGNDDGGHGNGNDDGGYGNGYELGDDGGDNGGYGNRYTGSDLGDWYCDNVQKASLRGGDYNRTGYHFGSGGSDSLSCKEQAESAGALHSDADYEWDFDTTGPKGNSLSEQEIRDYWDHYYINMTRWMSKLNNPTGTFATVIVDSANLSHIWCKAVSRDQLKFQQVLQSSGSYGPNLGAVSWIFHGEITAMWKCQEDPNILPQVDERTPNAGWKTAILYTNGESCNMCFGAISYIGIHEVVFGASTNQLWCGRGRSQHGITNLELADHAWMGGKDAIRVRGPLSPSKFESVRRLYPEAPHGLDRAIMSDFQDRRSTIVGEPLSAFQTYCPPGYPTTRI